MPDHDVNEYAKALLERIDPKQAQALVGLMETMLDPVSLALLKAPVDDEPETEEERQGVEASKRWFESNPGIPIEEVMAELQLVCEQTERGAKQR